MSDRLNQVFRRLQFVHQYTRPMVCFGLGLLGLLAVGALGYHTDRLAKLAKMANEKAQSWPDFQLEAGQIRSFLDGVTRVPHVAGTNGDLITAEFVRNTWESQGLNKVEVVEYEDVLLSYANPAEPNVIEILGAGGSPLYRTNGSSPPLKPEQSGLNAGIRWNAYSGSGTVVGLPVYVNYGRKEDFDYLEHMGVSVANHIAVIRYGEIWRGSKVKEAQKRGAKGVILYSDPQDIAPAGEGAVYPDTAWMPPTGVQRGSLYQSHGDPLTPLFPAKNYTFRNWTEDDLKRAGTIPSIPVQPVSYTEATVLMNGMRGPLAPRDWIGQLPVSYHLGPGYMERNVTLRMRIQTTNQKRKIQNVIGWIHGSTEPDRYVILGNHRDAWVYGAVDPNSGTAVMLEISRVLMQMMEEFSWRPKRTIVLCSWDAEEYGLIGSSEWVEENFHKLLYRTVAYLNVDNAVSGNQSLYVNGMPLLYDLITSVTKDVANPDNSEILKGRKTVYDTWKFQQPGNLPFDPKLPLIDPPHDGTDLASFVQLLGVPILDITYKNTSLFQYPLYHTLYDSKFAVENLIDPQNMSFHVAIGEIWLKMVLNLADQQVIAFNMTHYAKSVHFFITNELVPILEELSFDLKTPLAYLDKAARKWITKSVEFDHIISVIPQKTQSYMVDRAQFRPAEWAQQIYNGIGLKFHQREPKLLRHCFWLYD